MNINATKTLDLASSIGEGDIRCRCSEGGSKTWNESDPHKSGNRVIVPPLFWSTYQTEWRAPFKWQYSLIANATGMRRQASGRGTQFAPTALRNRVPQRGPGRRSHLPNAETTGGDRNTFGRASHSDTALSPRLITAKRSCGGYGAAVS
jgi:hypothetical protein